MNFLKTIKNYQDFKNLNPKNDFELADEIRNFLFELKNKKDIHYSSNLSVVELTISLLRNFDLNLD